MHVLRTKGALFGLASSGLGFAALAYVLFAPRQSDTTDTVTASGSHIQTIRFISLVQEGLGPVYVALCVAIGALLIAVPISSLLYASTRQRRWGVVLLVVSAGLMLTSVLSIILALTWQTPRALTASPFTVSRAAFQLSSQPFGLLLLPTVVLAGLATVDALRLAGGAPPRAA
jgi:hypothetical protein